MTDPNAPPSSHEPPAESSLAHLPSPESSPPRRWFPGITLPKLSWPTLALPQWSVSAWTAQWPEAFQAGGRAAQVSAHLSSQVAAQLQRWFQVSDAQMAEILAAVRDQLPVTEALLLGKPQSGKSSIVRGLTGVSAEIIGQGFRPHTQHTQRYAYPSESLPLLIFTDTVGLGDGQQPVAELLTELGTGWPRSPQPTQPQASSTPTKPDRARILILTVKARDFATEGLLDLVTALRRGHPEVPCVLAITCLHELYPTEVDDHPADPRSLPDVERVLTAIAATFAAVADRTVVIDFTLPEDGYTPEFYGLAALRDAIADLLPEAEARALHQLIDGEAVQQLGDLYRQTARRYLLAFSSMAATVAAVPLPFATMPVLTALQVSMVVALGRLYGQTLTAGQAGGMVSAIAGGFLAQAIGRELIKFIPGVGSAIAASWAAAYTWGLGEAACAYFGDLLGGKRPDPNRIQAVMQDSFLAAQQRFRADQDTDKPVSSPQSGV